MLIPRSRQKVGESFRRRSLEFGFIPFAYELQRRLETATQPTIVTAAHPGNANTDLQRHLNGVMRPLISRMSQSAAMGALPILRAATDPAAQAAQYFGPKGFLELSGHARPYLRGRGAHPSIPPGSPPGQYSLRVAGGMGPSQGAKKPSRGAARRPLCAPRVVGRKMTRFCKVARLRPRIHGPGLGAGLAIGWIGTPMGTFRVPRPVGNETVPLDGMTIRDLIAELTWVQDRLRGDPGVLGVDDDPGIDACWLERREAEVCGELRRRRGVAVVTPPAWPGRRS